MTDLLQSAVLLLLGVSIYLQARITRNLRREITRLQTALQNNVVALHERINEERRT